MNYTKNELKELIEKRFYFPALLEYCNRYHSNHDIEYLLGCFFCMEKNISKSKEDYNFFYEEYFCLVVDAIMKKILENNKKNRKLAEKLIAIVFKSNVDSCKVLLAASRFYAYMYREGIEGFEDKKNVILFLYAKAESLGGAEARLEKNNFLAEIAKADKENCLKEEKVLKRRRASVNKGNDDEYISFDKLLSKLDNEETSKKEKQPDAKDDDKNKEALNSIDALEKGKQPEAKDDDKNKEVNDKKKNNKDVINVSIHDLDEFFKKLDSVDALEKGKQPEAKNDDKNHNDGKDNFNSCDFDLNLVNADVDLIDLTSKLEKTSFPFTLLISGPPGTGKSYYLRYLVKRMKKNAMELAAADLFSTYQSGPAKNVNDMFKKAEGLNEVIILDEVEKITMDRSKSSGKSDWRADMTNAFLAGLEKFNSIFMATTNYLSEIDEAVLRRFVFKIRFDYLTKEQVAYAFRYMFNREPPSELFKIGGLTNGDFAVVKKKAQILGVLDDVNELCEMLKDETKFKANGKVIHQVEKPNFDRGFINIEGNSLDAYVKKIIDSKNLNFSILLHGSSGTGKSLYFRNLAYELGIEIIERKSSDIFSQWLGESEKNIANAFEEAKNRKAMLIFDEADSFFYSKENADRPWSIQCLNEFLVQLENHPYPVCATTNYLNKIEKAIIRRFKMVAEVGYLKKEQYNYVYQKSFGVEPYGDISCLTKLTPAIFALAKEKIYLEEAEGDAKRIFDIFLKEAQKANPSNKISEKDETFEKLVIKKQKLYEGALANNFDDILVGFVKIITKGGVGSGFFITKDGFIITNRHVVMDEKIVKVELFSGRVVPGEVVRVNSYDVALIKVSSENATYPLPIKTSEEKVSSTVFALGNPLEHNQVLSKGCITRYTKINDNVVIESDCYLDRGASGGPLFDEHGNVIGVNVAGWLHPKDKSKLGLNLHLSINHVLKVLNIKLVE